MHQGTPQIALQSVSYLLAQFSLKPIFEVIVCDASAAFYVWAKGQRCPPGYFLRIRRCIL